MLRRTLFMVGVAAAAVRRRMRGQSRGELQRMLDEQLATSPHKAEDIMRLDASGALEVLQDPGSSEFAKAKACQRLGVVGDDAAVSALAALLSDPKLSHYARTALEPMPSGAADRALREAAGKLEGALLVGVVNSIGVRRDARAISVLAPLRYGDDREVAAAATAAISRIRRP